MTVPDEPQPTYTLDEAAQILKDRRCAMAQQHHLAPVEGSHSRLRCAACDRTFDLVPVEEP